jgi:SAM-dependent methyltransferase
VDASERAVELARRYEREGRPTEWFERLYAEADRGDLAVPWAGGPNPNLGAYLDEHAPTGRALVVGCGLGEDAELLAERGLDVTAFDVSPTAIAACRRRYPGSAVEYRVADLFDAPGEWRRAFEFVVESYTLQALPRAARARAVEPIAEFVAPGGRLVVICLGRDPDEPEGDVPHPLAPAEVRAFADAGLRERAFEDYRAGGQRRLRATFERPE